ncbi:MAG: fibronectin type III domain-containing protein [Actinobacteria bacterium]|nr:fibronectin type III domain-containing protein [Actinomycetota bacterium]
MFASCSTTDLGCVISGLVSGSVYYVDVVASNSAGIGAPSAVRAISPGTAGSPPSNVTAIRDSKGLITVKWTPLASLAGATFAWYTAEAFTRPELSAGSSYSGFCTESSITASSCAIGGLKSNTTYYIQVRTVSSVGSSFPSIPRYEVSAASASPSTSTMQSKLTAPTQVKVIALSKSVRVSWKAPSSNSGRAILSYRAGAYGATGALVSSCKTLAKVYTCVISKLKASQVVYIGVVAIYSAATSPVSKLIPVTPKS